MKRARGFTIVEMLVVVTIILAMTAASVSILSVFLRGQKLKQAGKILGAQFLQARQRASSEKSVHFLQIDTVRKSMTLFRDSNATHVFDAGDERVADEHPLPNGVEFETIQGFVSSAPVVTVTFFPDGALKLPASEVAFDPDGGKADVVLVQPGQTHRLFLDVSTGAGKVHRQAWRSQ